MIPGGTELIFKDDVQRGMGNLRWEPCRPNSGLDLPVLSRVPLTSLPSKAPGSIMPVEFLMWIPAAALLLLLVLTLTAGALFSLYRTDWAAGGVRALWCAVILLLPVGGALAWLAVLQRRTRCEPAVKDGSPEAAG